MESNQNPFSLYDFLGYLIPGVFYTLGVFFLYNPNLFFHFIHSKDFTIPLIIVFILFCYTLGHILSYISSVTVEKYSIWTLGYPSRYILNYDIPGFWRNFWKGGKSKREVIVFVDGKEQVITVNVSIKKSFVEHIQFVLKQIIKFFMCVVILPIVITDLLLRKVLQYREFLGKSLDESLASKIKYKIQKFMENEYADKSNDIEKEAKDGNVIRDPDFFRLIYHYANEHTKNHYKKLQNYVALYGFTRTMCFVFVLLFWIELVILIFSQATILYTLSIVSMGLGIIAVFYLDFNKFYRRYTLEALMAFTAIYDIPDKSKDFLQCSQLKKP